MLKQLLHALAANPRVYDLAATVLGGRVSDAKLRAHAASLMRDRSLAAPVALLRSGPRRRDTSVWTPIRRSYDGSRSDEAADWLS